MVCDHQKESISTHKKCIPAISTCRAYCRARSCRWLSDLRFRASRAFRLFTAPMLQLRRESCEILGLPCDNAGRFALNALPFHDGETHLSPFLVSKCSRAVVAVSQVGFEFTMLDRRTLHLPRTSIYTAGKSKTPANKGSGVMLAPLGRGRSTTSEGPGRTSLKLFRGTNAQAFSGRSVLAGATSNHRAHNADDAYLRRPVRCWRSGAELVSRHRRANRQGRVKFSCPQPASFLLSYFCFHPNNLTTNQLLATPEATSIDQPSNTATMV